MAQQGQQGLQRTITLTDHAPVRIYENEWPTVGNALGTSDENLASAEYSQKERRGELDKYTIAARQHADGRAIVYAVLTGSKWTRTESKRGGELLDAGADIPAAIRRVGEDCGIPERLIRQCIGALPPVEL